MTRIVPLLIVMLLAAATPARADWWLKGFGGVAFARDSGIIDLDGTNTQTKPLFGVAIARDRRSLQIEAEVALSPRFFRNPPGLLDTGSLTTLTGNIAWMLPVPTGRISAYVIGGAGLGRIAIADKLDAFSRTSNKVIANAGAGAMVPVTRRLNVFGEARYFRTTGSEPTAVSFGPEFLAFWRATFGGRVRF